MAEVNINIPGYPAAKSKNSALVVKINSIPFFVKKGFDQDTGEPLAQEPVRITAAQVQAILDQATSDFAAVKAGCDALLADIAAATELK